MIAPTQQEVAEAVVSATATDEGKTPCWNNFVHDVLHRRAGQLGWGEAELDDFIGGTTQEGLVSFLKGEIPTSLETVVDRGIKSSLQARAKREGASASDMGVGDARKWFAQLPEIARAAIIQEAHEHLPIQITVSFLSPADAREVANELGKLSDIEDSYGHDFALVLESVSEQIREASERNAS